MLSFFLCGIFLNDILRWIQGLYSHMGCRIGPFFVNVFYQMDCTHLYE